MRTAEEMAAAVCRHERGRTNANTRVETLEYMFVSMRHVNVQPVHGCVTDGLVLAR